MLNLGVPEEGGTLFIQRAYVPALKLSTEWTGLDSLGEVRACLRGPSAWWTAWR